MDWRATLASEDITVHSGTSLSMGKLFIDTVEHVASDTLAKFLTTNVVGDYLFPITFIESSQQQLNNSSSDNFDRFRQRMQKARLKHGRTKTNYLAETYAEDPKEKLKALRLKKGLTQAELAKKANTTQAIISKLESGIENQGPTTITLVAIQNALEADSKEFWEAIRCALL
jgi:DNA-binding XRE family transcriptional regulator